MFVPSKARQGCRKRLGSNVRRSSCSPTAAELQNTSPTLNQSTASPAVNQPQEITAMRNEAPDLNQMGHTQSKCSTNSTKAQQTELSQEVLRKQQAQCKCSARKGRKRENCKVQFDNVMQGSPSQSNQEANAAQITNTEQLWDLSNRLHPQGGIEVNREESICEDKDQTSRESHPKLLPGAEDRERLHGNSNPCIMPRSPVLPGSSSIGTVGKSGAALTLLDLQHSFSKSEAHRKFNSSITHAAVNLRDNVVCGKKHNFYGINCYYIHG